MCTNNSEWITRWSSFFSKNFGIVGRYFRKWFPIWPRKFQMIHVCSVYLPTCTLKINPNGKVRINQSHGSLECFKTDDNPNIIGYFFPGHPTACPKSLSLLLESRTASGNRAIQSPIIFNIFLLSILNGWLIGILIVVHYNLHITG